MVWKKVFKDGLPPKPKHDVDVLLKVQNAPMRYIAAVWDGERFWVLEPMNVRTAPWTILPINELYLEEWAYIEE